MKYVVSMAVDGRIDVEVTAKSFEEAKIKAGYEAGEADLTKMEFINCNAVNAKNLDTGECVDYY